MTQETPVIPADQEQEPKLGWRTVPLTHPLIVERLTSGDTITLHSKDCASYQKRHRHYKARRDATGWHIRVGKRGTIKEYLTACEITYDNGKPLLFQFRTKEGLLNE